MKHYVFCVLLLLLFSCAPKEEDIVALTGTYTVTSTTSTNSNDAPSTCWLSEIIDAGNFDGSNATQQLNIKTGQIIQLQISGRAFQLSILGDNPTNGQPCTATGSYVINNRISADSGEMTFITTSSTCSGKTLTVHPFGNSLSEIQMNAVPSSIFSAENFFNISTSAGKLYIKLPLDMAFDNGNHDPTCNTSSSSASCTCLFQMNKS